MMKKVKFLYTLVLTSLIILVGGKSLSYADSSVEQLIIINSAYNTLNFYEDGFLVRKFSCATGKAYTSTPQGKTTVANKIPLSLAICSSLLTVFFISTVAPMLI